jgi:hypothetical protein
MTISASTTTVDNYNFNEFVNHVDNSRKTISMPTMHNNHTIGSKIFNFTLKLCTWRFDIDVRTARARSRRRLTCRSTCLALPAPESRFSAIDVESAFRSTIGWQSRRCGTSRSIWIGTSSGSICMRIRASTAATTLHRRPMFALTFSDHIPTAILDHNKERI